MPGPPTRNKTGYNIDSVAILSTQAMPLIPVTSVETVAPAFALAHVYM